MLGRVDLRQIQIIGDIFGLLGREMSEEEANVSKFK